MIKAFGAACLGACLVFLVVFGVACFLKAVRECDQQGGIAVRPLNGGYIVCIDPKVIK